MVRKLLLTAAATLWFALPAFADHARFGRRYSDNPSGYFLDDPALKGANHCDIHGKGEPWSYLDKGEWTAWLTTRIDSVGNRPATPARAAREYGSSTGGPSAPENAPSEAPRRRHLRVLS